MTDRYQDLGDTPPPVAAARLRAKVDELTRMGDDGWKELTDLYRRPRVNEAARAQATAAHLHSRGGVVWYDCRKGRQKRQKRASR